MLDGAGEEVEVSGPFPLVSDREEVIGVKSA